jgi:hypothetical protein
MKFIDAVSLKEGFVLQKKTRLFPVFHCGTYGWNINRKNTHQFEDWKKIGAYLHCTSENQLLQSAG